MRRRATQQPKPPKKKAKAEKPSAEVISDQERKRRLYMYVGRYEPLLAAKKETADNVKKLVEEAKSNGVPLKDLKLAIKLKTAEGEKALKQEMQDIARVARWAGAVLGTQGELFAKPDKKTDVVFDEGYRAGLENKPGKAPDHHGQNAQQRWLAGYHQGLKELNELRVERFGGMNPLSDAVVTVVDKAGAALGTAPPTHREDSERRTDH
jgi:uncharacterized protein (UPF0335 family)